MYMVMYLWLNSRSTLAVSDYGRGTSTTWTYQWEPEVEYRRVALRTLDPVSSFVVVPVAGVVLIAFAHSV